MCGASQKDGFGRVILGCQYDIVSWKDLDHERGHYRPSPRSPPLRRRPLHRKQPKALARPASRGSSTFSPRPAWTPPTAETWQQATNSVASSGEMLGKLREFIEKAHQSDAANRATRAKQRAAAAEAKIELATLDTLGSLGKFNSLSQFNPIGQSGSFGQLASLNQFSLRRSASRTGVGIAWCRPGPRDERPLVGHGRQDDQRRSWILRSIRCGRGW